MTVSGDVISSHFARTLSVASSGTELTYQWYLLAETSQLISGATAASYTTPPITTDSTYYCRVSSGTAFTDSACATLSVCKPQATSWSGRKVSGSEVTLRVDAPVAGETYDWYQGATGDTSARVGSGATLKLYPTTTTSYWLRTTRTGCHADTPAMTVRVCYPAITAQPSSATIVAGQQYTLSVTATGDAPLSYQWYVGSESDTTNPIAGATSRTYTTPALSATTPYWVRVSSPYVAACGPTPTDSQVAVVTVCYPPSITQQPAGGPVVKGSTVTLTVQATGTGLTYQWYEGSSGVTTTPVGGPSNSLTVTVNATSSFWARVTGSCGTADSAAALLSVAPTITTQPSNATICYLGETATFNVVASGTNVTYEWYRKEGTGSWALYAATQSITVPINVLPTSFQAYAKSGQASTASNQVSVSQNTKPTITGINRTQDYHRTYYILTALTSEDPALLNYAWYEGQVGDTSKAIGTTRSVNVVPVSPVTYWVRVSFKSTGCYATRATSF